MSASRLLEANPECWRKCSALGVLRGTLSPRDPLERGPHPVRVGATSGRPQDVRACEMALRVGRGRRPPRPNEGQWSLHSLHRRRWACPRDGLLHSGVSAEAGPSPQRPTAGA